MSLPANGRGVVVKLEKWAVFFSSANVWCKHTWKLLTGQTHSFKNSIQFFVFVLLEYFPREETYLVKIYSQFIWTEYQKKKQLRNTCSRIMSKGCCAIPWSCNHGILPLRELLQRANSDECFWPSRGKVHEYYVSSFKINIASARVSGTAVCFKITWKMSAISILRAQKSLEGASLKR